jgi:CheY-like chemotaxis protein
MKELTVLLAEDNHQQAARITQALKNNVGVGRIVRFQDGQSLLDYLFGFAKTGLSSGKYLLLLDIVMPCVNGIEVLKTIKSHVALKCIPVIMFSSIHDPHVQELCYQYGCNAFISKPFDEKEFDCLTMLDFISIMQVPSVPSDIITKIASGGVL